MNNPSAKVSLKSEDEYVGDWFMTWVMKDMTVGLSNSRELLLSHHPSSPKKEVFLNG